MKRLKKERPMTDRTFLKKLGEICRQFEKQFREKAQQKASRWYMHRDPREVAHQWAKSTVYGIVAQTVNNHLKSKRRR